MWGGAARWPSTGSLTTFVAAAAIALTAGTALSGCGSNLPSPGISAGPATSQSAAQAHNQADVTFLQEMIPHHAQAIAMSTMAAQQASSARVKDFAAGVKDAQQPEIDQMGGWLRDWKAAVPKTGDATTTDNGDSGAMPGMMSANQMSNLGQATGAEFDRMFLRMMITHHQGAVTMAKSELTTGRNPEARQLAQSISDTQQREIMEMKALLAG